MIILFDSLVIRIKQLVLSLAGISFVLMNHLDWLNFLHISKTATDRIEFAFLILIVVNRPAGYIDTTTDTKIQKEQRA